MGTSDCSTEDGLACPESALGLLPRFLTDLFDNINDQTDGEVESQSQTKVCIIKDHYFFILTNAFWHHVPRCEFHFWKFMEKMFMT